MSSASRLTRFVAVAAVAVALPLSTSACSSTKAGTGGGSGTKGAVKIGLITKTDSNPFWVFMRQAAEKEAKAKGVTLVYAAGKADGDNASQVAAVENMVAGGVKAIIIDPSDSTAIVPTLEQAQKQGVFVLAVDTQTQGNKAVSGTWATDNQQAGVLLGKYMKAALAGKKPVIGMLDLQPGVTVGDQRHNGFLQGFGITDKSPDIAGREDTNGDQGKGQTAMEDLLQKVPDFNVVYSINEPAGMGGATAVKNAGKQSSVLVGSIDGSCTGVQQVKSGAFAATVMQFPAKMATDAVDAGVAYIRNGVKPTMPASGYIDTGEQLITDKPISGVASKDSTWGQQNCWGTSSS